MIHCEISTGHGNNNGQIVSKAVGARGRQRRPAALALRRLCVQSMLRMFHTAQQLQRTCWICLQSFYTYACSFMHVKEITYLKGKKGSSNLSAQS